MHATAAATACARRRRANRIPSPTETLKRRFHHRRQLPRCVLHVIPELVANPFHTKRAPTSDAEVEYEIIIAHRWPGTVFWCIGGEYRWSCMQTRDNRKYCLVCHRDFKGGYVDWPRLAVNVERRLCRCSGRNRGGRRGGCGNYFINVDVRVQYGVLKRLHSKPRRVFFVVEKRLSK